MTIFDLFMPKRAISVSEAKSRFCGVLKEVAEGVEIEVTSHGRPVARLIPPGGGQAPVELIRPLSATFDWRTVRPVKLGRRPKRDAVATLLEDRAQR
jgi:prevent-host-death family protein